MSSFDTGNFLLLPVEAYSRGILHRRSKIANRLRGKDAGRTFSFPHDAKSPKANAVVSSRIRELQEALSAGVIAVEISSRNARVRALQKRWDRLRA